MKMTITLNTQGVLNEFKDCFEHDDIRLFFYNEFYRLMEDYVPADTLSMYDTAVVSENGIHFVAPYSSFPYFGKTRDGKNMHYTKDRHPLATDHWDVAAWTAKQEDIVDATKKYIIRRYGNG